jgi:biopolymer transport protein ExbD
VDDPSALTSRLSEIFKQRENNGVFREGTNQVEKTIFIKSPKSVRYGDVVKVIDAAKTAGAEPIGLQVDDLTE